MAQSPDPPSHLLRWVEQQVDARVRDAHEIQSLWSGYGSILRVALAPGSPVQSAIVKHVQPPSTTEHPRGWGGRTSHERKLKSYQVERAFYRDWCRQPVSAYRTARCFAAEERDHGFAFLLEDLDAAGFAARRDALSQQELHECLRWLAAFHAAHLGRAPEGLWPVGTYWHLATRQDELAAMDDRELHQAAKPLDALLRACPHQTLVHGDAKVANFCFGQQPGGSPSVAAVDFQYVGGGCGIQDVAYFLSSCLDDAACEREAPRHLDTYFAALRHHLPATADADSIERTWRGLYPAAWADFHRFLNGWAPDHWKIHSYTRRMTRAALRQL